MQGLAEGSHLILVAHNQARQILISLDQLRGSGNWGRIQDRVLMEDQAIKQVWNSPGQYSGVSSFSSPGDIPNPGIKPRSPVLQADSLPAEPQEKPKNRSMGSLSLLQQIFPTQESK